MSKSRKYPDIVGALFSTKIKKFVFFDKSVADALITLGEKVEIYDRRKLSKPVPASVVIRKTCLDGTATIPPEPDNRLKGKPDPVRNSFLSGADALPEGLEASPELQEIVEKGLDDEAVVHFPIKTKKRHHREK